MENYFRTLTEIKTAVSSDDVNASKILTASLNHVNSFEKSETIWNYQRNAYEKPGDINLICLACKSSAEKVLEYLFTSENCLYNLPSSIQKSSLFPEIEVEECHNAFYYAIHSNDCILVEIVIEKRPNDLFKRNFDRLDNILSEAY
ncbi:hypothetical protein AVEN_177901-1 [Araneus ventricosus]|uniref:Uncharacterized protein n=1 Tax=Araneus ventricosus TaxID=182803 RepID=A0A4Y2KDM1_ARAVE|nr:hypothetical protein AVEN_177901-1 [Araneus ventricosus]